jgi:pyruvate ferredoxin oxidoreductase beta subunit
MNGKKDAAPVDDYLMQQGRFNRLLQGPDATRRIEEIQGDIDREIAFMRERAKITI